MIPILIAALCLWNKPSTTLVVAAPYDYQSYLFSVEGGQPRGILVDYWLLLSQKAGLELEFLLRPWSVCVEMVKDGRADAIIAIYQSEERKEYFDFTDPYYEGSAYIYYHDELGLKNGPDDFIGLKLGLLGGDYSQAYVKEHHPSLDISQLSTVPELLQSLNTKVIDAVICDQPTMDYFLNNWKKDIPVARCTKPLYEKGLRIAIKKGNPQLLARLNMGISSMLEWETDMIKSRWFGEPFYQNSKFRVLSGSVIFLLICIGLIVLWNRQLRKKVAIATQSLLSASSSPVSARAR